MDDFSNLNCGDYALPWNMIFLVLGILVAVVVTELLVRKRKLYKDLALDLCIVGVPCGIVGARLFSAISGKIAFSDLFMIKSVPGLNLFGALLFAFIGILVYSRIKKFKLWAVLDIATPGIFFGLAVGRWSDFFLCDGVGATVKTAWLKFFPVATFTKEYFTGNGTNVAFSVFFLEFLVCVGIGLLALLVLLKKPLPRGTTFRFSAILYLFLGFFVEWMRTGDRQVVFGGIHFNQLVYLIALLALIATYFFGNQAKTLSLALHGTPPEEDDDGLAAVEPPADEEPDEDEEDDDADEVSDDEDAEEDESAEESGDESDAQMEADADAAFTRFDDEDDEDVFIRLEDAPDEPDASDDETADAPKDDTSENPTEEA